MLVEHECNNKNLFENFARKMKIFGIEFLELVGALWTSQNFFGQPFKNFFFGSSFYRFFYFFFKST